MTLQGKVAVITGSGLIPGSQIAIALAKSGVKVAVEGTEGVLRNVETFGGDALPMRGNFAIKNDVRFILSNVEAILGKVDILINSLNIEEIGEANVESITTFTETVITQMKTQDLGHILLMAVTDHSITPEQSAASHQAIVEFSETISRSLSETNIKVTLIPLESFQNSDDSQMSLNSDKLVEEVISIVNI